jgi:hypothetical protein
MTQIQPEHQTDEPTPTTPEVVELPPPPNRKSTGTNTARWFWGTILALMAITLGMTIAAHFRHEPDFERDASQPNAGKDAIAQADELPASELEKLLSAANAKALVLVNQDIGPLLDKAYKPVYAAIPVYADFHYSVWGEYVELSEAALGNIIGRLQEIMFVGLGSHL